MAKDRRWKSWWRRASSRGARPVAEAGLELTHARRRQIRGEGDGMRRWHLLMAGGGVPVLLVETDLQRGPGGPADPHRCFAAVDRAVQRAWNRGQAGVRGLGQDRQ